jgi:hypothetical protein
MITFSRRAVSSPRADSCLEVMSVSSLSGILVSQTAKLDCLSGPPYLGSDKTDTQTASPDALMGALTLFQPSVLSWCHPRSLASFLMRSLWTPENFSIARNEAR